MEFVHGVIEDQNANIRWKDLSEDQVETFIGAYNASPPQGEMDAKSVRVYHKPGARTFYVVVYTEDCVIEHGEMPIPIVEKLMRGLPVFPAKGRGSGPRKYRQA